MTVINMGTALSALTGSTPTSGWAMFTPWRGVKRAVRVEGAEVVIPAPIRVPLSADGPNLVEVMPNPGTWCWHVDVGVDGESAALTRDVSVLHADEVVDFGDDEYIVDVDPFTFLPSETGRAAWEAVAGQATQAAAQAAEAAEAAAVERAAAGTAAFNAGASAAAAQSSEELAVSARGDAVAASSDAIAAQSAAELAKTAAEDAAAAVAPGVPGGTATLDGGGKVPEVQVPARLSEASLTATYGSQGIAFFEDFTALSDGPIAGRPATFGGDVWHGTGQTPPEVVDGGLQSTGTGYAWQSIGDVPAVIEVEFEYRGSGTPNKTLTIATSPVDDDLNTLLHLNLNPTGWDLTFRVGGVWSTTPTLKQVPMAGNWRKRLNVGQAYRAALLIDGDTVTVVGPHGERFTTTDPNVAATSGRHFFVEPVGSASGVYPRVLKTTVYQRISSVLPSMPLEADGSGWVTDEYGRLVSNRHTAWEVSIGRDPALGIPSITFGPYSISTFLTAATLVGATQIVTSTPLYSNLTLIIGPGTDHEETVTTSGNASGTGPYTHTVTALVNAHPAGTQVLCVSVPSTRRRQVMFNAASSFTSIPNQTYVDGTLYLGSNLDTQLSRSAAGVLSAGAAGMFRTGRNTTANRPSAATAGSGSMFFDTTLNKPIWSTGTAWVDAMGAAV